MRKYTAQKTTDDLTWYAQANKGFTPTGEYLTEDWGTGCQTLVVFNGRYTPYGMCRDCGDHYIIARYDRYDRVDKNTLMLTKDVEDR